jgi:hypothetical protein
MPGQLKSDGDSWAEQATTVHVAGVGGISQDGERLVFDAPGRVEAGASMEISLDVA